MSSNANVFQQIKNIWEEFGDPRTSQWFLTATLYPIIGIIVVYLTIVLVSEKLRKFKMLFNFVNFKKN